MFLHSCKIELNFKNYKYQTFCVISEKINKSDIIFRPKNNLLIGNYIQRIQLLFRFYNKSLTAKISEIISIISSKTTETGTHAQTNPKF